MNYRQQIQQIAPTYDPRHIEGYMRSEHGTLDHLSSRRFNTEVRIAVACVNQGGIEMAERIAKSFGL
jgi:hypothetical protein